MSVRKEQREAASRRVCRLPLDKVFPNPRQPRKAFDEAALMELASSIRQHGLLQPITVRVRDKGYEIIMGERRCRACKMLGHTSIDAFILPATEGESAVLALIENLQRENLHFFEEAEAYADLISKGMTQEALARRIGKSPSAVANRLRLLKLEPELRRLIFEEGLTERHARALLTLPDGPDRMRVARQAALQHLTVRDTEFLIQRALKRLPVPPPARKVISLVRDYRLYLNAVKSVVAQMRETGFDAEMETREGEEEIEVRIQIRR